MATRQSPAYAPTWAKPYQRGAAEFFPDGNYGGGFAWLTMVRGALCKVHFVQVAPVFKYSRALCRPYQQFLRLVFLGA